MHPRLSPRRIWGMPILITLLSAVGLLSALLGDGIWDALSWFALAAPVLVTLRCVARSLPHGRRLIAHRS